MDTFERKEKYLVLNLADVEKALGPKGKAKLDNIINRINEHREKLEKPQRNFVCIHDGMKCYEAAWKLVEDEVNGKI